MNKVLITTSSFDLDLPEIKAIQEAGYKVVLNPHGRRVTSEEVKELLTPDVVGMIAGVEPLTRDVIEGAEGLRVISRCGIGLDSVDLDAAEERSIPVFNTPDAPTRAVAELTIGLILDLLRSISKQDRHIRDGEWTRPMGGLLGAKTLGLIGFGRIGRRVADYAAAFGTKIIMHDPFLKDDPRYHELDDLLALADIVSLHIPYSEDNHHMIDTAALKKMKQGAYLVNTARGGLIDEDALVESLEIDHLAGAALDVFEEEPYKGPLARLEKMLLTAHVGSYAREARKEQEALAAENLLKGLINDQKLSEEHVRHG